MIYVLGMLFVTVTILSQAVYMNIILEFCEGLCAGSIGQRYCFANTGGCF